MLGWHWMAELEGIEVDATRATALLDRLATELGLTVMAPAQVHRAGAGLVAVLLLGESHASLHVTGDAGFVDVFSCVAFDTAHAEGVVREVLRPATLTARTVERRVSGAATS